MFCGALDLLLIKTKMSIVFADINCRLKTVFKDGTFDLFKDISELNERI